MRIVMYIALIKHTLDLLWLTKGYAKLFYVFLPYQTEAG